MYTVKSLIFYSADKMADEKFYSSLSMFYSIFYSIFYSKLVNNFWNNEEGNKFTKGIRLMNYLFAFLANFFK